MTDLQARPWEFTGRGGGETQEQEVGYGRRQMLGWPGPKVSAQAMVSRRTMKKKVPPHRVLPQICGRDLKNYEAKTGSNEREGKGGASAQRELTMTLQNFKANSEHGFYW